MSHTQLAIISIIFGVLFMGFGIRYLIDSFHSFMWMQSQLLRKITVEEPCEDISYKFGAFFMIMMTFGNALGLALLLIGIHYLP